MNYTITKTYGAERGLSCCYRQWRSKTHCQYLHGYSLGFRITVGAYKLNECGHVFDFGKFKGLWEHLQWMFDHTLIIQYDDPLYQQIMDIGVNIAGQGRKFYQYRAVDFNISCENFAKYVYNKAGFELDCVTRVTAHKIVSVECFEHGANSAVFSGLEGNFSD